jgi:hypothetical protein
MGARKTGTYRPGSVLLTDWAADEAALGRSLQSPFLRLVLLSLLYDEILVQDEVFVLSNKLARWFTRDGNRDLLWKLLEIGSIKLLTHPRDAYPKDLRDYAEEHPILARAQYIQALGSKGRYRFVPSTEQKSFYSLLESCLFGHPSARREVSTRFDVMTALPALLRDVLSKTVYASWIGAAFGGITRDMARDFVRFIERPKDAVETLKSAGKIVNVVSDVHDNPVFNRSLAYQLAGLYPEHQEKAMQRLIQTAFAAPFSWREGAVGTFSSSLREMIWRPGDEALNLDGKEEVVIPEVFVDVYLTVPIPADDFPKVIGEIRNEPAGKQLRQSIREIGSDRGFQKQIDCWKTVAQELARRLPRNRKRFSARAAAVQFGTKVGTTVAVEGLVEEIVKPSETLPEVFTRAGVKALGVVFDQSLDLLRRHIRSPAYLEQFENLVKFRCTWMRPVMIRCARELQLGVNADVEEQSERK